MSGFEADPDAEEQDTGHVDEDDGAERRRFERFATRIQVDYSSGDTFLFSYIQNISEMGIFIRSTEPLPVGTKLSLRFNTEEALDVPGGAHAEASAAPLAAGDLEMEGEVVWINPLRLGAENPNPGMGVRFTALTPELRERVVALVRTVAYLQPDALN